MIRQVQPSLEQCSQPHSQFHRQSLEPVICSSTIKGFIQNISNKSLPLRAA